jgi:hypothetical protein
MRLRILQACYELDCRERRIAAALRELWAPFVVNSVVESAQTIDVTSSARGWHIRFPGFESDYGEAWDAINALTQFLSFDPFTRAGGVVDLHAAVVVKNGSAMVLPGGTGVGKTTLAISLAREGWTYYSDDRAPLDVESGRVFPYPRPPGLKGRSQLETGVFDGLVLRWPPPIAGAMSVRPPPGTVNGGPVFPGWLVVARFEPGVHPRLVPISPARAATHAGRYARHFDADVLRLLIEVASHARCAEFVYGSTAEALAELRRWSEAMPL